MNHYFHLIGGLEIGGCERMLTRTVPHLKGGTHHVVVLQAVGNLTLLKTLQKAGIPVHLLNARSLWDRKAVTEFKRLVREYRPNVLTTYLPRADFFGRFWGRRSGIKTIYCSLRSSNAQLKFLPYWIVERLSSFLVSHYLAVSKEVKRFYNRRLLISSKKITVLYNGLDPAPFQKQVDTKRVRESLGIPGGVPLLGCVAKLRIDEKGQGDLVEAMKQVVTRVPEAQLLLIGGGPDRQILEKEIEANGLASHIHLLGDRNDVPALLKTLDLFVLPTRLEGMSNAILEAMASGCPILTTDIPQNRELVEHNRSAYLVPSREVNALAEGIETLLSDSSLRQKLAEKAAQDITRFDIKFTYEKWNRLYAEGP